MRNTGRLFPFEWIPPQRELALGRARLVLDNSSRCSFGWEFSPNLLETLNLWHCPKGPEGILPAAANLLSSHYFRDTYDSLTRNKIRKCKHGIFILPILPPCWGNNSNLLPFTFWAQITKFRAGFEFQAFESFNKLLLYLESQLPYV